MAKAELRIPCNSAEVAKVLWDAISADDAGSVEGIVEDDGLVIRAGPAPMASLRVTLDDLLACLQAASGTVKAGPEDEEVN